MKFLRFDCRFLQQKARATKKNKNQQINNSKKEKGTAGSFRKTWSNWKPLTLYLCNRFTFEASYRVTRKLKLELYYISKVNRTKYSTQIFSKLNNLNKQSQPSGHFLLPFLSYSISVLSFFLSYSISVIDR